MITPFTVGVRAYLTQQVATMKTLFILNTRRETAERQANPTNLRAVRGIPALHLNVNPGNCKTPLGRWLAEQFRTLDYADDLSTLFVYGEKTQYEFEWDRMQRIEVGEYHWVSNATKKIYQRSANKNEFINEMIRLFGADTKTRMDWRWGSLGLETPEEFFDRSARAMMAAGGIEFKTWLGETFKVAA